MQSKKGKDRLFFKKLKEVLVQFAEELHLTSVKYYVSQCKINNCRLMLIL